MKSSAVTSAYRLETLINFTADVSEKAPSPLTRNRCRRPKTLPPKGKGPSRQIRLQLQHEECLLVTPGSEGQEHPARGEIFWLVRAFLRDPPAAEILSRKDLRNPSPLGDRLPGRPREQAGLQRGNDEGGRGGQRQARPGQESVIPLLADPPKEAKWPALSFSFSSCSLAARR